MMRFISSESDADGFELQKRQERETCILRKQGTRSGWLEPSSCESLFSKGCEGGTCLMRDFLISFL